MTDEEALTELTDALRRANDALWPNDGPSNAALAHVRQRLGLLKEVPLWAESIDFGRGAWVTGTPR